MYKGCTAVNKSPLRVESECGFIKAKFSLNLLLGDQVKKTFSQSQWWYLLQEHDKPKLTKMPPSSSAEKDL